MTQPRSNDPAAPYPTAAGGAAPDAARAWAAEPAAYPRGPAPRALEPVEFTGSGREYFRIWAVNLCLSVLTLGLYSPWAKVRRLQYFYRHTRLAGASFDYHGKPTAILKGRLVVGVLLAAYYGLGYAAPVAGALVGLVLLALSPWFFLQSLKFRMANTSYRGLRFRFHGTKGRAAGLLLLWPMFVGCSGYLLLPHWLWKLKKFEFEETSFGRARFTFGATSNAFYSAYLVGSLMAAPVVFVAGGLAVGALASTASEGDPEAMGPVLLAYGLLAAGYLAFRAFVQPYIAARVQQHVWSSVGLGAHHFVCDLRPAAAVSLAAKNVALTLLTLGLYAPYAAVAMTKLRAESVRLAPGAPLDHLEADDDVNVSAFADAVGDYADYDFGL
ncbi:MAG TPA: YjgN family protein [Polyangiaceae bacterium]|nr:YjgN family protein [Polyangiaceae bacterium]